MRDHFKVISLERINIFDTNNIRLFYDTSLALDEINFFDLISTIIFKS